MLSDLHSDVKKLTKLDRGEFLQRFFKTEKGQYGYGDIFAGISVPQCRTIAKKYKDLSLSNIQKLLTSKIHEERLIALFILVHQYKKAPEKKKKTIYDFYLKNTKYINNWDLVDSSADKIVGEYLVDKPKDMLYTLAKSEDLWEKRIAIIATYAFIRKGEHKETFKIAEMLLYDKHDLIHKAVGWMLREVGKRCSREVLIVFLAKHYKSMPRTALRYSIEHFPQDSRKKYLTGTV